MVSPTQCACIKVKKQASKKYIKMIPKKWNKISQLLPSYHSRIIKKFKELIAELEVELTIDGKAIEAINLIMCDFEEKLNKEVVNFAKETAEILDISAVQKALTKVIDDRSFLCDFNKLLADSDCGSTS